MIFCLGTVLNLGRDAVIVGVRNAVVDVPTADEVSGVITEIFKTIKMLNLYTLPTMTLPYTTHEKVFSD